MGQADQAQQVVEDTEISVVHVLPNEGSDGGRHDIGQKDKAREQPLQHNLAAQPQRRRKPRHRAAQRVASCED